MRNWTVGILIAGLGLGVFGCSSKAPEEPKPADEKEEKAEAKEEVTAKPGEGKKIVEGGLYAFPSKYKDYFQVMKVISVEEHTVHLIRYSNRLQKVPEDLDLSTLTMGVKGDPKNLAFDHMALAMEWFWPSEPVFMKKAPITQEDLEGYNRYKANKK